MYSAREVAKVCKFSIPKYQSLWFIQIPLLLSLVSYSDNFALYVVFRHVVKTTAPLSFL